MGNDKPVCESREHVRQAEVIRDSDRNPIDWLMDVVGFPKEDADLKKVACMPKEEFDDLQRPKLNAEQRDKVNKNVAEVTKAIGTGDLTAVGEFFNRLAPVAQSKTDPAEFHNRGSVKVADETFYQLNKQLGRHGIEFDYRDMGVYSGDRSPSLIISREHKVDKNTTEHLELTLQGGTMKDFIKHSAAERVLIRDYGGPGVESEYIRQPVASAGGKTAAESAYQEIMLPFRAANRQK
ncbi:MAG: hypothetical protein WC714_11195 [Candidatus Obscuribacterales bacterium]|jgi:hypothetical protein